MSNRVPLNNVDHAALKALPLAGAEFGAAVNQMLLVPAEFELAQREYPIFFRTDPDGNLQAVALLGLDRGENLFLEGDAWTSRYVPAVQRRGPFFAAVPETGEPVIHVDLDDPRIGETDGEPLFLPHGGHSPYLEQIAEALQTIHAGLAAAQNMFALFSDLGLLQPVELTLELGDGLVYKLPNFLTIGADQFSSLNSGDLERLNRSGFLPAAIFVRSSLGNLERLVELKNRASRPA